MIEDCVTPNSGILKGECCSTNVDIVASNSENSLSGTRVIKCKSNKLNLSFEVNILNETGMSQQKCFVLTIHDLGYDSTQYEKLLHHEKMVDIRNRVIWLNVTLPGQETEATDLDVKNYPTLEELADALLNVIDELKIPQVVCMGSGAGANIAFHFACKHSTRCLGLVLIEPVGSAAGLVESLRHMFGSKPRSLSFSSDNEHALGALAQSPNTSGRDRARSILNRLDEKMISGSPDNNDTFNMELINSGNKLIGSRNIHNVKLFAESFFNRNCLIPRINELKADTLIACGRNSSFYAESKKLYKALQEYNRKTPRKLVNSPFLELDNVCNVLKDAPDNLATSLQYFLQGIGLVSAMPLRNSLRSMSVCISSPPNLGISPTTSKTCGDGVRSMSQEDNSTNTGAISSSSNSEEQSKENSHHSNQSLNQ